MIEDNCIVQMFLDQDITGGSHRFRRNRRYFCKHTPEKQYIFKTIHVETQKSGVTLKQYVIGRRDTDLGTLNVGRYLALDSPVNSPPTPFSVFKEVETQVRNLGIKRLVIDSLSSIRFTSQNPASEERSIGRFIRNLKNLGCTTILLSELTRPDAYTIEQFASHGVIFLHNFMDKQGNMVRALQIIKMRGTKHDCDFQTTSAKLYFKPRYIPESVPDQNKGF